MLRALDYIVPTLNYCLLALLLGGCALLNGSSVEKGLNSTPVISTESPNVTTPSALPTATRHTLRLQQTPRDVALNESHLYWTTHEDKRCIWRFPLRGGEIEAVICASEGGELATPLLANDWLVFSRISSPSPEGITWTLSALNLSEGREQVIVEKTGLEPLAPPSPQFDADGDWVVWTETERTEAGDCIATILTMHNLRTAEQHDLERACGKGQDAWTAPHLSGNRLVVLEERPAPDDDCPGYDVYLYEGDPPILGQCTRLTDDGQSYAVGLSNHWLAWRTCRQSSYDRGTVVHDLRSARQYEIAHDRCLGATLDGRWLSWEPYPFNPLYVYDLEARQTFTVADPGEHESIGNVALFKDWIAWSQSLDFTSQGPQGDHLLIWVQLLLVTTAESLPFCIAGMYENCPTAII